MKCIKFFLIILVCSFLESCDDVVLYKAGNRKHLIDLQIESNIDQDLILQYIDSFKVRKDTLFALPEQLDFLLQGGDLKYSPYNNKAVYFKNSPIEVYQLSSNGVFFLAQVYNMDIYQYGWTIERDKLSSNDYNRIEKRIDTLFHEVVKAARADHLPDSVIFWKKPYDTLICNLQRPPVKKEIK